MGIDDLKRKQQAAMQEMATWNAVAKTLTEQLEAGLASLEGEIRKRTKLELGVYKPYSDRPTYIASEGTYCRINQRDLLRIRVVGLTVELTIATIECKITRTSSRAWQLHLSEGEGDRKSVLDTESHKPCVPLALKYYKRNIWWCGPEDNRKLASAIVDLFSGKELRSDFELHPEKHNDGGCATLLAMGFALVFSLILVLS
jgi:hypothetical protein